MEDVTPELAEQKKHRTGKPRACDIIPIEVLVDMYLRQKMTQPKIAEVLGITVQTVNDRLRRHGIMSLYNYRENEKDILCLTRKRFISSITERDIKKLNARDRIVSAGILYDKEFDSKSSFQAIEGLTITFNVCISPNQNQPIIDITPQDVGVAGQSTQKALHNSGIDSKENE